MAVEKENTDRELESITIETQKGIKLKRLELETKPNPGGPNDKVLNALNPKFPYIDRSADKMESFLTRFGNYATTSKCDPSL